MNRIQLTLIAIAVLIVAAASRFVSMAGLSVSQYGQVLEAYFRTSARAETFIGQYVYFLATLVILFFVSKEKVHIVIKAAAFFCLVSVARYFIPVFLVSNIGDLAVFVWMVMALRKKPLAPAA